MDLHRPTYHFMPEKNWMNDPNGVCYYKGEYHLFYQYNPHGAEWGDIHWGHAKSRDLVHWQQLPIALSPAKDKGELHCFSGCAVVSGENPLLFYTSVGEGDRDARNGAQLWMAAGDQEMLSFRQSPLNPLLTADCHGVLPVKEWRDPYIIRKGTGFIMVLGASVEERGCALLYESEDLINWRFLSVLAQGDERIWECPNLLEFGEKSVLVISPDDAPVYFIGTINEEHRLITESKGILDAGGFEGYYAPNSFTAPDGRTIMIGWMPERARGTYRSDAGWSGIQSIPRTVELVDGSLVMKPVKELEALRNRQEQFPGRTFTQWEMVPCKTHSRSFELLLTLEDLCGDSEFFVEFLKSRQDGKEEKTVIRYTGFDDRVVLDRTQSSLSGLCSDQELSFEKTRREDGSLTLHLFVDCSSAELFINYEKTISARMYPTRIESDEVCLGGKHVRLKELSVWSLEL